MIGLVSGLASVALAYPDQERLPADPSTLIQPPLQDIINDQPDAVTLSEDGRYLFFAIANEILRMDLASWDLTPDQIPALTGTAEETDDGTEEDADEGGNVKGLAVYGSQLFASQDDGDLVVFDLDDITADPLLFKISDGELGDMVVDPEGFQDEDKLYIADVKNKQIHVFDISSDEIVSTMTLVDSNGDSPDPVRLAYAAIPNGDDKIYVATSSDVLFTIGEKELIAYPIESADTAGNQLVSLAATPDGDYLFVVDQTASLIHILDTATDSSVTIPNVDTPIDLQNINASPRDIVITRVKNPANNNNPSDIYAYIAGPEGLTVLDLDINSGVLDDIDFISFGADDDDPLVLSNSSPNRVFSPSEDYILTVNGNAEISVISENPFVTITEDSLAGGALTLGGDFTLTFEADEAGTYSVRLGGGLEADGLELTSGDVSDANTPVTTAAIAQSDDFIEGDNEVFVFVTDADGNRGRDMTLIKVDTPPPILVLNSTGFGNERVFLNFNRLDIVDIDHYNLYAATDATTALSKTEVDGTVNQPAEGKTVEGKITGLTNGVTYYIAAEAVDEGGNVGPRNGTLDNGVVATAIPQATVGIAARAGETGCQLVKAGDRTHNHVGWILLVLAILPLIICRLRIPFTFHPSLFTLSALLIFLLWTPNADAVEASPQWFSLEVKVGEYIPTNDIVSDGLGKCCNERYGIDFGFLYNSKLGAEIGVGFLMENRTAIGEVTGAQSRDRFNFMLIPMRLNVTFRADFKENQIVVPYVKAGPDFVFFRENVQGDVTKGMKYGLHGSAGAMFLLEFWGEAEDIESEGVNDVYFVIEGDYAWIDSFGAKGLDLSGFTVSGGFLFEF